MMAYIRGNKRGFFKGAQRRAQLYRSRIGRRFLGDTDMQMGAYFSRQQLSSRFRPSGRSVFQLRGLDAEPLAPTQPTGLFAQFTELAKQALPVYQQARILREQQRRRAAGLPPLESEQLAPTVRVQGGLDPGTMRLGKIALWGGLALGAGLLAMSLSRR